MNERGIVLSMRKIEILLLLITLKMKQIGKKGVEKTIVAFFSHRWPNLMDLDKE